MTECIVQELALLSSAALVQDDDIGLDLFLQKAQDAIQCLTRPIVEEDAHIKICARVRTSCEHRLRACYAVTELPKTNLDQARGYVNECRLHQHRSFRTRGRCRLC